MRGTPRSADTEVLEGRVRDVTQAGESVVETDKGVVFVRGALPDERVRVGVESRRAGVLHGRLLQVLDASPQRVSPACEWTERCGGCPLMSLSLPAQQALKLQRATRALEGVCQPGVAVSMEAVGPELGYRRRVRMAFRCSHRGNERLLGYYAMGSRTVVDTPTCIVLEDALQRGLRAVREVLLGTLAGTGEVELAKVEPDGVVIAVSCDAPVTPQAYRAAEQLAATSGVVGVTLRVQGGAPATFGATAQVSVAADGAALSAPASSFAQANASVNAHMVQRVVELAEPAVVDVVELYAGHGNFTVALAQSAASVAAFELDAAAADACRHNLRVRGLTNARVFAVDADAAKATAGRAEVLVLDPPRAGAPALTDIVARVKPERVVYVSCHMTTLGRDLHALAAQGYVVDRALLFDMFPQTAHVEAVVRARRIARSS